MDYKMKIAIELPDDRITENILRKGKWKDDSLFARVLRNALMHFTRLPSNNADIDADMARRVDSLRKMANKINELEVTDEFSLEIMDKLRGAAYFIESLGQQIQSNAIDKCRTCEKAWTDDCEQSECWNNNYDKYVQSYCDACENLRKGDYLSTSNSFGEIEDTIVDINFCPKCGRKLPEMEEKDDSKK